MLSHWFVVLECVEPAGATHELPADEVAVLSREPPAPLACSIARTRGLTHR